MNSFIQSIQKIIDRDLTALEKEPALYTDEQIIWVIKGNTKNSAGNLTLHLCGNLQYYIGGVLGNSGYVRNREYEFAARGLTGKRLLMQVTKTKNAVQLALKGLHSDKLTQPYPEIVFDFPMTTEHFLIHLTAHLGYHLGQINYHRRMIQNPSI
jgi:hypothetical protein